MPAIDNAGRCVIASASKDRPETEPRSPVSHRKGPVGHVVWLYTLQVTTLCQLICKSYKLFMMLIKPLGVAAQNHFK
jgi:hypothetical protein